MKNKFRSDLSIAKNLGSSGSGSCHWLKQRVTAIILVLFTLCLMKLIHGLSQVSSNAEIVAILKKPYNITLMIIFVATGIYHGMIGMQVVIEDYIHCRVMKISMILATQILCLVTIISFIVALFSL